MKKVEEFEKERFEEERQRIRLRKGKEIKLNPEAEWGYVGIIKIIHCCIFLYLMLLNYIIFLY